MKKILLLLAFAPMLGLAQTPADFTFYNKGADIYVQPGALIHVQGSLTNGDGTVTTAAIKNDGILEVEGDLYNEKNNSIFQEWTTGGGSTDRAVKLVGAGTQKIMGNFFGLGNRGRLFNLIIDKKNATDTVEMNTAVNITGSLVFGSNTTASYTPSVAYPTSGVKGVLKTYYFPTPTSAATEFILDVQNTATDAIAGYPALTMNASPTTGFIITSGKQTSNQGGLQRKIGSTSSYVYPIGTYTNGYNPAQLNFSAVPGTPGSVRGKFVDVTGYSETISQRCVGCATSGTYSTPDNNGYNRFFPAGSTACNPNAQWIVLEQAIQDHGYWSYAAGGSNTGYAYTIETFPNGYVMQGNNRDTWRVIEHKALMAAAVTSDNWTQEIDSSTVISNPTDLLTYTKNAGCYSGNGVPGGVYTDFTDAGANYDSHFAIAKSKSNNALPVTLVDLRADAIDNQFIRVSWVTATEINNAGFNVMRSTDGVNFTFQGFVNGHNNSIVTESYVFDDHNVEENVVYYYKLEQIDNNGHSEEFGPVSAVINAGEIFTISDFSPNPTKDASKLIINTSVERSIDVKLFDLLGRQLSTKSYNLSVGQNTLYFDVQTLANATYTAVITTQNKVFSKKLVVAGY